MTIAFGDNSELHQFEVFVDGERAGFMRYRRTGDRLALVHTEIDERHEGRGLAAKLVVHVLDDARRNGLLVLPYCPYVHEFIDEHRAEYLDLVPTDRLADFGWDATDH